MVDAETFQAAFSRGRTAATDSPAVLSDLKDLFTPNTRNGNPAYRHVRTPTPIHPQPSQRTTLLAQSAATIPTRLTRAGDHKAQSSSSRMTRTLAASLTPRKALLSSSNVCSGSA